MGRIFVYRQARFTGSAWNSPMILNGQSIGEVPSGAFLYVDRPPGDYTMISILGFSGYQNPEKSFSLAAGQTVYLRMVTDMSGTGLELMSPSVAANEIQSTSYNPPGADLKAAKISGFNPATASSPPPASPSSSQSMGGVFGAKPATPGQSMGPMLAKPGAMGAQEETNHPSLAATPDDAEKILELRTATPATGLYALDDQTAFNVLDSVYYDPSSNVLSLVGHFDERYRGPKIPYLQHLAVLLKNPQPEFSLNWTADSEQKVDAFFNQHVIEGMSGSEADGLMARWGRLFDEQGQPTRSGRLLLPLMGVSPIEGGREPGAIGMQVSTIPDSSFLRVVQVIPGSPAESVDLRPGDEIKLIRSRLPINPEEFSRYVRMNGAGSSMNLVFQRSENGQMRGHFVQITPAAASDPDVWKGTTNYDVLKALYLAAGDRHAADVVYVLGMMARQKGRASEDMMNDLRGTLIDVLRIRSIVNADFKAVDDNSQTGIQAMYDIDINMFARLDEAFHFPGSPCKDAFVRVYAQRGGDPAYCTAPAMDELDRQILPKVKELLNPIFERPEGLQIPPELFEEQFHLHPEMVPEYLGVPGDSLLAQIMFDSDYLCKRLMNRPELKQKIAGYQTGFEFEVKNPQFRHATGMYRIWISVDKMDTPQSPDGMTLALRNLTMRFNVREQDGNHSDVPNKPGSYEELLTSLWDDFEVEYPTLHELRETAKLAAAARWMLAHDQSAALPEGGRLHWHGPKRVPGLMFMELAPDPVQGATKTHVTTIAEGGVSEAPPPGFEGFPYPSDTSVVDLRGSSFFSPPAGGHVYTTSAPAQGAATTETSPFAVGWAAPTDPNSSAGGKLVSAVVVTSTFGSKVVKANFAPSSPITPGTDTKAGDQLLSAAATAQSNPDNLTQNFDVGGARSAGSVNYGTPDPWGFSKKVRDDPRMIDALKRYNELQARREQLNVERDQLALAQGAAKDDETMKKLTADLDKKNKEYQENLLALSQQKETVVKTQRLIDDTVEDSPPTAPTSPAPGSPPTSPPSPPPSPPAAGPKGTTP